KQAKRNQFLEKNPVVLKVKEGTSNHQERVGNIEARVSALLVRRAELRARLGALERAVKEGDNRAELLKLIPTVKGNEKEEVARRGLEDQLLTLKLQKEQLLEDYGKDHPQVRSLANRIALTEALLQQEASRGAATARRKAAAGDPLEQYLLS